MQLEPDVIGTIEEEFNRSSRRIRYEAKMCKLRMNRKYASMDAEDIQQEGSIVFFKLYRRFKDGGETDGLFFRKYLCTSIRNKFKELVAQSHRLVAKDEAYIEVYKSRVLNKRPSVLDDLVLIRKLTNMSPEAQEYIKLCLEFNDEQDMHKWRAKYVCEQLNFSRRLEVKIRNEIKESLRG